MDRINILNQKNPDNPVNPVKINEVSYKGKEMLDTEISHETPCGRTAEYRRVESLRSFF